MTDNNQTMNRRKRPSHDDAEQRGKKVTNRRHPKIDPIEFWGDPERLPEPVGSIDDTADVMALVSSLGPVPISGRQTAAEHWLRLVYERASMLAGALAAAGGLNSDVVTGGDSDIDGDEVNQNDN